MNKMQYKEITGDMAKGIRESAFRRHPNKGMWAPAYYRRVAAVIEGFVAAGVGFEHKMFSLCLVLADTSDWDVEDILHAWRLTQGDEREMYSFLEAWRE